MSFDSKKAWRLFLGRVMLEHSLSSNEALAYIERMGNEWAFAAGYHMRVNEEFKTDLDGVIVQGNFGG